MSSKEDILKKYRANVREKFDMPDLSDIAAITYPDPLLQFMNMTKRATPLRWRKDATSTHSSVSSILMPKK